MAGQIFRIGTMGQGSTAENVLLILRELETALKMQGYRREMASPRRSMR